MDQEDRLIQITRIMDHLELCRSLYGSPDYEIRLGLSIGELDSLTELHRLLFTL